MTIPRDLGVPFDPTDPVQLAEFEGFGTDVPTTADLITAVQNPSLVRPPAIVRAARMFRPSWFPGFWILAAAFRPRMKLSVL